MNNPQPCDDTPPIRIKIAFFDVGQGDTIVISSPDTQEAIVVDCINEDVVLEYLVQEQIKHLRGIIITHWHADHFKRVINLVNGLQLKGIGECEILGTSKLYNDTPVYKKQIQNLRRLHDDHSREHNDKRRSYQRLLKWVQDNKSKIRTLQEESDRAFPLKGTLAKTIKVVHPHSADMPFLETYGQQNTTVNNVSVVLHVKSTGAGALLTGDLEHKGWQKLSENVADLKCDLLKFPHHGAWRNADPRVLLNEVNPSLVVISVGCATQGNHTDKSNKYGHPNEGVLSALRAWGTDHLPFHLLCTQATSLCQPDLFGEAKRLPIRDAVATKLGSYAKYSVLNKNSCPCAGTVVVELDQTAQLIQPKAKTHRQIISNYFSQSRCI